MGRGGWGHWITGRRKAEPLRPLPHECEPSHPSALPTPQGSKATGKAAGGCTARHHPLLACIPSPALRSSRTRHPPAPLADAYIQRPLRSHLHAHGDCCSCPPRKRRLACGWDDASNAWGWSVNEQGGWRCLLLGLASGPRASAPGTDGSSQPAVRSVQAARQPINNRWVVGNRSAAGALKRDGACGPHFDRCPEVWRRGRGRPATQGEWTGRKLRRRGARTRRLLMLLRGPAQTARVRPAHVALPRSELLL